MNGKDDRGEPVFSGETVDKILKATIIEHAEAHAQDGAQETPKAPTQAGRHPRKIDKKALFKIALLALTGIITVACFLLVGNFYFIKKGKKKKKR